MRLNPKKGCLPLALSEGTEGLEIRRVGVTEFENGHPNVCSEKAQV